jgi:hypothetical protein
MMDTQTTVPVTLTEAEAEVLTQARLILKAVGERLWEQSWSLSGREAGARGRVTSLCETTETAIFDVLNAASCYLDDEHAKAAIQAYYDASTPEPYVS